MPVSINKSGNRTVTVDTATATYVVAGNTTTSNIASNNEVVSGANISRIWFSSNGSWTVARGANTIAVLTGTDHWDLASAGMEIPLYSNANLTVTLSASAAGTIVVELKKLSTLSGTQNL